MFVDVRPLFRVFLSMFHPIYNLTDGGPFQYLFSGHTLTHILLYHGTQAHSGERCHTYRNKIRGHTKFVMLQQFYRHIQQLLFCLVGGRNYFGSLDFRCRQCFAVHLPVGGHRHYIHQHISVRHHVFCKRRFFQSLANGFIGDVGTFCYCVVQHKVFSAYDLLHLSGSLKNAIYLEHLALNLT